VLATESSSRWAAPDSAGSVNSLSENWFSRFKTEFYHHHRFTSTRAAATAILDCIEFWRNRRRPN